MIPHSLSRPPQAPSSSGGHPPLRRLAEGAPEVDAPLAPFTDAMERVVPAFSVCIAVRDRPLLLVKSIRSVLASSFEDFEIVVVDDGSTVPVQEGLAAAGLLAHQRIRLVRQKPSGIAAARNIALKVARGRFITVLDSDDELAEEGLSRLQEFLTGTGASWIYTDYQEVVGGSSKTIRLPSYKTPRQMLWSVMTRPRLPFKHSGMTIDRDLLLKLGGYDEQMPIKVDIELILRALSNGIHPIHLAYPIVRFHRHGENVSRRRIAGLSAWSKLIKKYSQPRIPGVALIIIAFRTLSELGKWFVSSIGK